MLNNGDGSTNEQESKPREIRDPVKELGTASAEFLNTMTSVSKIMGTFVNIFSQLEGIGSSFNKSMGGADIYSDRIKQNIIEGRLAAEEYGFNVKEVESLQNSISEKEKTNFLLRGDQYKDLLVQGELTKGISETAQQAAAKNYEMFKSLGMTAQGGIKANEEIIQQSLSYGVAAKDVAGQLRENVKALNFYNFDDGVKGMARMASEAIMVKSNMRETLKIAEDLFNPERAVTMAADLQRMGVQITGLLDPISLMNMGENDPEALQKNLIELSKQYVEFDEKQQRFKIMPGAQREVREIAKALGMSKEEFVNMGINALDLDRKLSQIKFPDASEFANDDTRKLIANMAQFNEKTGKYEIEVYDEKLGQNVMKAVDSLEPADSEMIEKAQKAAQKSSEQLLIEANGYLLGLLNTVKASTGRVPFAMASSRLGQEKLKTLGGTALPLAQAIDETIFGEGGTKALRDKFTSLSKGLDEIIKSLMTGQSSLKDVGKEAMSGIGNALAEKGEDLKNLPQTYQKYQQEQFAQNPELNTPFQLTPDMLQTIGETINQLFSQLSGAIQLQDGLISPSGGLIVSGPKGSYFGDKDDSVLLSPNIPSPSSANNETTKDSKVTAEGRVEIEHKFTGVEDWFKNYMLSQGFMADFVPTLEKFLTKTEG